MALALLGLATSRSATSADTAGTRANPAEQPAEPAATGAVTALADTELILSVGTHQVYWPEYRFWLRYTARAYALAQGVDAISRWDVRQQGMPLRDYLLASATTSVCSDAAIEAQAASAGIDLTDDDLAEQTRTRQNNLRIYGSEAEYRRIVDSMYESETQFSYLNRIDRLSERLFARLYGAQAEACSDQCIAEFAAAHGLVAVLYIFRAATDAAGHPLPQAQRASNRRLLRHLLDQLRSSPAPGARFARLMQRFSEDRSLSGYPDGRLLTRGALGGAFDAAVAKLPINGISEVLSQSDGDYLILRKPLVAAMAVDSSSTTLRYWAAYQGLYRRQIDHWCQQLPLEYAEAYRRIDVEALLR